jgi:malonyl CoA-acyl carrier protein transacylase
MQSALPNGEGAMIAILQADLDVAHIRNIAQKYDLDAANFNSPSQVVLSGLVSAIDAATPELEVSVAPKAGRVIRLQVSGPFHSRWMRKIEPVYRSILEAESSCFSSEQARFVTSNVLGGFHNGSLPDLVDMLTRQISSPVLWLDNMRTIVNKTSHPIIELGPGNILQKFFKEIGSVVSGIVSVRHATRTLKEQNV